MKLSSRPGFAAAVIGLVILAHLAILPMVLHADPDFVYFGSTRLPEVCSFRTTYGIPCPTCGMTRGVVLALHGHLEQSVETNASAPVLVGSGLGLGLGLLMIGGLQMRHRDTTRLARWIRRLGLTGAGLWAAVLAVNWIVVLRSL